MATVYKGYSVEQDKQGPHLLEHILVKENKQ